MRRAAGIDWDSINDPQIGRPGRPRGHQRRPPAVICVSCLRRFYRHVKDGDKFLCERCREADQPAVEKRPLPIPYNEFPPGY